MTDEEAFFEVWFQLYRRDSGRSLARISPMNHLAKRSAWDP